MSEDHIEILGERFTRAQLRKAGPEVVERCRSIFPPGRDQAVLVAFARDFNDEPGLTSLELRAAEIGRNLTCETRSKPDRGPSPFDDRIDAAVTAAVEADDTAGVALEALVKAQRAVTRERSKTKIDAARLDASVGEAAQVADAYKVSNLAAVKCKAALNNLGRARDGWRALREYHASQKK